MDEPDKPKGMHWSTYNRLLDQPGRGLGVGDGWDSAAGWMKGAARNFKLPFGAPPIVGLLTSRPCSGHWPRFLSGRPSAAQLNPGARRSNGFVDAH